VSVAGEAEREKSGEELEAGVRDFVSPHEVKRMAQIDGRINRYMVGQAIRGNL